MNQLLDTLRLPKDASARYLLVLLFGSLAFMLVANGEVFYSLSNLQSRASQIPLLGVFAFAMAICMLTGGINLSIIATTNASALVMANIIVLAPESSTVLLLALVAGFVAALIIGLFNGILSAYIGVSPILATLGSMTLINGFNILLSGGSVISGFPDGLLVLASGAVIGIPIPLLLLLVIGFILWLVLEHTVLGQTIFLLGSNEEATFYSGVNTKKSLMYVYAISSILCWVAALIMMAKFNSAKAGYGESYLLTAILASVLGGINPDGGFGRVIGIGLALIVLQVLESGMNLLGISSYLTMALWGGIIILFIALKRQKA